MAIARADAAAPQLNSMVQQLNSLGQLRDKLPAAAKQSLAAYARTLLPLLRSWIENALKVTGVEPVLRPIANQLLARIEAMAKS